MNKLIILFITAIIAVSLAGCWSATTETNTENANANADEKTVADFSKETNVSVNVGNNSTGNTQTEDLPPTLQVQTNKVGNHIRTGKPGIDPPGMKNAEKQYNTGLESSLISTEMNKDGNPVETRKFSNNPQLDKIEVTALGEKERKILVYLKNGKVLPLQQGKLTNPMVATSYEILKSVGIEVKAAPPTGNEKSKVKEQNRD